MTSDQATDASTRAALIDAAVRVFRRRGYDRARVQEIAREAGFTTGAIYGNFEGKAELLAAAVASYAPAELEEFFRPVIDDHPSDELFVGLLRLMFTGPSVPSAESLVLDGLAVSARDPEVAEHLRRDVVERAEVFRTAVDNARATGRLDPDLPTELILYFSVTLLFGSMAMKALGYEPPDYDAATEFVKRLLEAFRPREKSEPASSPAQGA